MARLLSFAAGMARALMGLSTLAAAAEYTCGPPMS